MPTFSLTTSSVIFTYCFSADLANVNSVVSFIIAPSKTGFKCWLWSICMSVCFQRQCSTFIRQRAPLLLLVMQQSIAMGGAYILRSQWDTQCTLVAAFVATWVDYCNTVSYGISYKHKSPVFYRWSPNAAVHLVVSASKFDHITPVLRDVLHWLTVPQRIQFTVSSAVFECVRRPRHRSSGIYQGELHSDCWDCWLV